MDLLEEKRALYRHSRMSHVTYILKYIERENQALGNEWESKGI